MNTRIAKKEARNEAKRDNCPENRKRRKRGKVPLVMRNTSCKGGTRSLWRLAY